MISFSFIEVIFERVGRGVLTDDIQKQRAPADHSFLDKEARGHFELLHISAEKAMKDVEHVCTYIACL